MHNRVKINKQKSPHEIKNGKDLLIGKAQCKCNTVHQNPYVSWKPITDTPYEDNWIYIKKRSMSGGQNPRSNITLMYHYNNFSQLAAIKQND